MPLFPFHTWLPDAHVEAPTAGSVILAGVLLKMGTYGLLRFAFPLFPDGRRVLRARTSRVLAVIGIVYGALVAMVQPDMKKLVAYSSVSHLGFVVLGICALNVQGVQGAVYQMLNHGVCTGGALPHRRHAVGPPAHAPDRGVRRPEGRRCRGWWRRSSLITLSSIGLPGLNGFVGEFLILLGAFRVEPAVGGGRRDRRDPLGRLHALDVPARELRAGDQRRRTGRCRTSRARERWVHRARPSRWPSSWAWSRASS